MVARVATVATVAETRVIHKKCVCSDEATSRFHLIVIVAQAIQNSVKNLGLISYFRRELAPTFKKWLQLMKELSLRLVLLSFLPSCVVEDKRGRQCVNRKHRFWVREMFTNREEIGTFNTMVQELRLHDREFFYRYSHS